jgi:branched-chain amino acid transport system permease protein
MSSTLIFGIITFGILNAYVDYINFSYAVQTREVTLSYLDFRLNDLPGVLIISSITTTLLVLLLHIFITRTKLGVAIRATIENSSLAESLGINTVAVRRISWFLSGGITSIAGTFYPLQFIISPITSFNILLSIFAASVLGGLSTIYGGLVGGLILGFIQKYLVAQIAIGLSNIIALNPYIINQYSNLIPLVTVALTLLFFPKGIIRSKGE